MVDPGQRLRYVWDYKWGDHIYVVEIGRKSPSSTVAIWPTTDPMSPKADTHLDFKYDRSINRIRMSPAEFVGDYSAYVRRNLCRSLTT